MTTLSFATADNLPQGKPSYNQFNLCLSFTNMSMSPPSPDISLTPDQWRSPLVPTWSDLTRARCQSLAVAMEQLIIEMMLHKAKKYHLNHSSLNIHKRCTVFFHREFDLRSAATNLGR